MNQPLLESSNHKSMNEIIEIYREHIGFSSLKVKVVYLMVYLKISSIQCVYRHTFETLI